MGNFPRYIPEGSLVEAERWWEGEMRPFEGQGDPCEAFSTGVIEARKVELEPVVYEEGEAQVEEI